MPTVADTIAWPAGLLEGAVGSITMDVPEHRPGTEGATATALAHRIRSGDETAEAELVERYSPGLRYLLGRLTGSPELAEELQQETLSIVIERLRGRGLDDPAGLLSFLRATARNLAAAEHRRSQRRGAESLDALAGPHPVDPQPGPAAQLVRNEEDAVVRRLIGELSTRRDREILYRFYVAEDDKEQICSALGLGEVHFNRVLHRARQRFKELVVGFEKRQRLRGASLALWCTVLAVVVVRTRGGLR